MCVLTCQFQSKHHKGSYTKKGACGTHPYTVGYQECVEKVFSFPWQLAPRLLLGRKLSSVACLFDFFIASPHAYIHLFALLTNSLSPQSPGVMKLPSVPRGPLPRHTWSFSFLAKRQTWADDISGSLPLVSLGRPVEGPSWRTREAGGRAG